MKNSTLHKLPTNSNELTQRQCEVAMLLMRGWSRQQIANQLVISLRTVQTHATAIYRKRGVDSQTALIVHMRQDAPICVPAGLSPRQIDVILELATGKQNKQIAGTLTIGRRTVDTHLSDAYARLGVASRAEAVARCVGE